MIPKKGDDDGAMEPECELADDIHESRGRQDTGKCCQVAGLFTKGVEGGQRVGVISFRIFTQINYADL
jgi:hypothetical protein